MYFVVPTSLLASWTLISISFHFIRPMYLTSHDLLRSSNPHFVLKHTFHKLGFLETLPEMVKDDRADFAFRTSYDDTYLRWPANPRGPRRPPDELEMAEGTIKGPTMYTTHYSDLSQLPEDERRKLETQGSCSNLTPSPREAPGVIEMGGDPCGDRTCGVTCGKFPAQGDKSVRPESFFCATKYESFFPGPSNR